LDLEALYKKNEKLVYFTLNKYYPTYANDEDWQQNGRMYLWKACLHYDENKGAFTTFAVHTIKNSISSEMRKGLSQKRGSGKTESVYLDEVQPESKRIQCSLDFVDRDGFYNAVPEYCRSTVQLMENGYTKSEASKMLGVSFEAIRLRLKKAKEIADAYI